MAVGLDVGFDVGFIVGLDVVGDMVGFDVGFIVGLDVGLDVVGPDVGLIVGLAKASIWRFLFMSNVWRGSLIPTEWHQLVLWPRLTPPGSCPRAFSTAPSSGLERNMSVAMWQ